MDLRAPFIPFVHVRGIPFDLTKEIKKPAVKRIQKTSEGTHILQQLKCQRQKTQSPNKSRKIEESFRFFDNANFGYTHFRNSSGLQNEFLIYIYSFLGSEEIWRNATKNKPETFEQVCGNNSFQDEDSSNSSKFTTERI